MNLIRRPSRPKGASGDHGSPPEGAQAPSGELRVAAPGAPAPAPVIRPPALRGWRRWLRWPTITIDLSRPRHRRNLFLGFVGLVLAGTGFLFGGYQGYAYSETPEFCGALCHPMAPQFTRYEASAHAKVECVKCHIGPGASFFVKSKIDGLRQVYAVTVNNYDRPIKSPVHDLRPARETCETCHAPTSFKDNIIKTIVHYDNDAANTRVQSTLILKMGGWEENTGVSRGIHWHITSQVEYIAADAQRQVILWVSAKQPDGATQEFFARDMLTMAQTAFVQTAREEGKVRRMDCIDCHNRTAHFIPEPEKTVDEAISAGKIASDIPYLRAKAVEVLTPPYNSQSEAFTAVDGLRDYYRVGYPEFYESRHADLETALAELKRLYANTNFPDMGLNWQTNPNNERHTPFLGCFRCHDDKHVSVDPTGNEIESISVKCNLCHTVPIVGRGDETLVEAPVIVGAVPASHSDFRWTVEHRSVTETERPECYNCHGQAFCNNSVCHNLSHPPDMLFTHPEEYKKRGDQVCYTCHQNFILCSRCHPGGVVKNP